MPFTEILKVRPVLDNASASDMEARLSHRFSRVAKRFGAGLKAIVKGSVVGISLGLIAKLLNPLEAIEERIKALLGQGSDLRDLADRFGSDAGQIFQLQAIGESVGLSPEKLQELMLKFAEAVETARKEIKAGGELSAPSIAVKQFAGDKNLAESFATFLKSIRSDKKRDTLEELVLGGKQFGAGQRLIDTDFVERGAALNLSGRGVGKNAEKLASLADQQNLQRARDSVDLFERGARNTTGSVVQQLTAREKKEQQEANAKLLQAEALLRGAKGIDVITGLMEQLQTKLVQGLGYLVTISDNIAKMKIPSWLGGGR